ncbi:LPS export ABC transporter permease LptG [Larsenimonas rhizosphaerae]|uniref:LPS export ABC transporter permease LptG n=1 Tax=Larsenimonas rhizosphaerae TaxID=2944682 RepID=A0AA42CY08_9GAMM|nr:LPS export ABC transporter permease LptG [Larsenimonas rhizosphaerae]MCM2129865.1 LPS export ABC transporter permease LptG [Larsenimonas rhizosphaerae]MCX2524525.1 LPS export ABC transporter permease LptG [Larsenimonas rhizosphaerae]
MFKQLDRYIARNVLSAMLVVQLLILGLDFIITYINDLSDVEGDYGAFQVLIYLLIRLPYRFYEYAPVGVLLGALLGLGAMASSNELTIMRAAGWSLVRIIWGVMKPLGLVILVTMATGELVAPHTEQFAASWRDQLQQGRGHVVTEDGGWQREGNSYYNFGSIQGDSTLINVNRYRFDGNRLVEATHADRATYHSGSWQLQDVSRTRFSDKGTVVNHEAQADWDTELKPALLKLIINKKESQSMVDLWRYGRYLNDQGLQASTTWLYFWQKLLQPAMLAGLVLVAASFIFGPLRTVAAGTRVFYGIITGLVFKYLQDLLAPASTIFGFSPIWAVLLPTALCFIIGLLMLRRTG